MLIIVHVAIDGMFGGADRRAESGQSARHFSTDDLPEIVRNLIADVEDQLLVPYGDILEFYSVCR